MPPPRRSRVPGRRVKLPSTFQPVKGILKPGAQPKRTNPTPLKLRIHPDYLHPEVLQNLNSKPASPDARVETWREQPTNISPRATTVGAESWNATPVHPAYCNHQCSANVPCGSCDAVASKIQDLERRALQAEQARLESHEAAQRELNRAKEYQRLQEAYISQLRSQQVVPEVRPPFDPPKPMSTSGSQEIASPVGSPRVELRRARSMTESSGVQAPTPQSEEPKVTIRHEWLPADWREQQPISSPTGPPPAVSAFSVQEPQWKSGRPPNFYDPLQSHLPRYQSPLGPVPGLKPVGFARDRSMESYSTDYNNESSTSFDSTTLTSSESTRRDRRHHRRRQVNRSRSPAPKERARSPQRDRQKRDEKLRSKSPKRNSRKHKKGQPTYPEADRSSDSNSPQYPVYSAPRSVTFNGAAIGADRSPAQHAPIPRWRMPDVDDVPAAVLPPHGATSMGIEGEDEETLQERVENLKYAESPSIQSPGAENASYITISNLRPQYSKRHAGCCR